MPTDDIYPAEYAGDSLEGARAPMLGWRDFIVDARLIAMIEAALARNRDLAVAIAQIEQARGTFRVRRADRVPTLVVNADASRSESVTARRSTSRPIRAA